MNLAQDLRPRSNLFDEELERLRRVAIHNDLALAAAFHLCADEGVPPPRWLLNKIDEMLIDLLKREKAEKRGSHAGRIARYRQDMREYMRWEAVEQVRQRRKEYQEKAAEMAAYSLEQRRYFGCIDRIMKWFRGGTLLCASMWLRHTDAFASPSAIKASYRRVSRRLSSPSEAFRYYIFWGDFLIRLGVPWPGSYEGGRKFTPFYDLKP